eukprot:1780094-Pleurochrysis_carterae.AAC.1
MDARACPCARRREGVDAHASIHPSSPPLSRHQPRSPLLSACVIGQASVWRDLTANSLDQLDIALVPVLVIDGFRTSSHPCRPFCVFQWFIERGFTEGSLEQLPPARQRLYNAARGSKIYLKTLTGSRSVDAQELFWSSGKGPTG